MAETVVKVEVGIRMPPLDRFEHPGVSTLSLIILPAAWRECFLPDSVWVLLSFGIRQSAQLVPTCSRNLNIRVQDEFPYVLHDPAMS